MTHNIGAGNETRTRDIYLGKVTLYQLSYSRSNRNYIISHYFLQLNFQNKKNSKKKKIKKILDKFIKKLYSLIRLALYGDEC